MEALSFNRAADYYDETRALPHGAREELADVLAAELAAHQPCLEIGIGTGRIALPLRARGITLAGADIAEAMLRRLVVNAGDRPPPLLLADATRLPAAPLSFGGVLASHVLHLIPGWRVAVDEAVRVLRPGGVLLSDFGGRGEPRASARTRPTASRPPWSQAVRESLRRHGITRDRRAVTAEAVTRYLRGRVSARPLPPVRVTVRWSLGQTVADMERQIFSWTWPYTAEQMRAVCADIRAWAASENVPLDAEHEVEDVIQWWAFDLAAPPAPGAAAPGSP